VICSGQGVLGTGAKTHDIGWGKYVTGGEAQGAQKGRVKEKTGELGNSWRLSWKLKKNVLEE